MFFEDSRSRELGISTGINKEEEESHGEEGSQKAQIFAELRQRRQKRNAPLQKGHRKKRPWRQGRKGQKPQAGDSHWPFEGPQEGKEGPEKTDDKTQILSISFEMGVQSA
jgi:hypothetical protein